MIENRNYIVAIALSIAVLLGWQYFVAGPRLEAEHQRQLIEQAAKAPPPAAAGIATSVAPTAPAGTAGTAGTAPAGASATVAVDPAAVTATLTRPQALAAHPRVAIDTPVLGGSIDLVGGRIDDVGLKHYRETVDPTSPPIDVLSPVGTKEPYFADFGWLSDAGTPVKVPGPETVWTQKGTGALSVDRPVVLTWDNGEGLVFERTVSVDDKYMFSITDQVTNGGERPTTIYPWSALSRFGTPTTAGYYILHEGAIGVFGDEGLKEIKYADLKEKLKIEPNRVSGGWIGFVDKYWASALIPEHGARVQPRFAAAPAAAGRPDVYQTLMLGEGLALPAGGKATTTTRLFAGAKEVATVDGYAQKYDIAKFDRLIDWGWFYFLTKPLFFVISWLHQMVGNFGIAILIVTVFIKGIFYPLASKSYESMSKMKKVQPEMKALQETYKDDRTKQQQALMELYKREKINPLAGCLPIVIQIPVFFSLYKVLFVTIEMRQAPFYGWIRDLAVPDPTSLFNLFGLVPFTPPHMLMIGAWPLIMGVTMFVQMKLNPPPPDPTQKIMFDWMPVLFTFMLANMPAGLVIYWTWNNTLSIAQQAWIMKKNGVRVELWDNVRSLFRRSPPAAR
ncbi:membrane protein insertase YidC [Siculibacillus lacustris]|uniref:Membrane protein insertase YidC n=1 Tax=Siculibacillus lacustris TaxID=1549641 RepID=A0A4Q9VT68_9HYPH|nr:membrane protein insertase YidC [Siculibacillus lacustris]TBW39266.1 membrane protein insertase YidC [Siculibacillus lacustris]